MAGKEYTTAPILVNADGHPIPQYLDITDTTDSPQGTFKPLTQLQAEHPDVQNVQLTGSNVPEEVLIDDEPLFAGSTITTSEFSTKNANEIRFVLTCSVNIFDDLDVFFSDVALDRGFSRYVIEDVRGETRYKTFVAKPASKAYRVRLSAEGDQDINVTLQAFYYYS